MRLFGLIGYPLGHSFSKAYFSEKFKREGIADAAYELFPLPSLEQFPALLKQQPQLSGLNVTLPHKQQIIPYLQGLHASAEKVGAVNVIKREGEALIGYNSDYFGFKQSLEGWLGGEISQLEALVLGTGGAAKAVCAALTDLSISFRLVSRTPAHGQLSYLQLQQEPQLLQQYRLLINTTPLGTYPNVAEAPELPYQALGRRHFLYDLVYNPAETHFMLGGKQQGAAVKGGLEMLELQAQKAWEIWNS